MDKKLIQIASSFAVDSRVVDVVALGDGFINDTYIATCQSGTRYILQRKNSAIFTDVPSMMDNILRVTSHLKQKIVAAGGNPAREALTVIPATNGKLYVIDNENRYWAMCLFIEGTIAYNRADTADLAAAGGCGIGKFQAMLADFSEPLTDILPGFHDMRFRFKQWDAVLAADPVGRVGEVAAEIEWVESRRQRIIDVWTMVERGQIPTRVTHNDTKINNILFDKSGNVLCVIDLDTVLSATILNDFGDGIRTYTNTGAEDDQQLDRVSMDIGLFEGFTRGYLSQASQFLVKSELDHLAYSGAYIVLEQVLRFLMDYIAGDTYYKIKSPTHNLIRTRAQYKLLQSIEQQMDAMNDIVRQQYQLNSVQK